MAKFQQLGLALLCLFYVQHGRSQSTNSHTSVSELRSWLSNSDGQELIGNYHSINLKNHIAELDSKWFALDKSNTLFIVLKPRFKSASGLGFAQVGRLAIYDNVIVSTNDTINLQFTQQEPAIFTLTQQPTYRYARQVASQMAWGDTSLYSLAEILVFDKVLNREEVRRVNTYLALKYSIPITKVKEVEWRDYLKGEHQTYWNSLIDQKYNERVTSLGRNDADAVLQTQTITSTGGRIKFSLQEIIPDGGMPTAQVEDGSFIVFSERKDLPIVPALCPTKQSKGEILKWKFQLQHWESVADKVLIEVENAMMDEDSLFVTDGLNRIYIASYPGSDSSVVYSIPLNGLKSSTHYFFSKIPKSSCEEFVFEELNGVITATSMGFGEGPWVLESRSLETGMVHSVVLNGESGFIATQEGQQLISVYDANGQLVSLKVIQGSNHTNTDNKVPISLRVYPNPTSEGSTVKAQVMGLSEQKAMTWMVNESTGKLISAQTGNGLPFFERQFSFTQQGTYIITVLQGDQLVSSKVLVIGQ